MSQPAAREGGPPDAGQARIGVSGGNPLKAAERRAGILFTLPVLLLTGGFLFLPILQTVFYSLTRWDGVNATFIGVDNFQRLFSDAVFWRVLLNNAFLLLAMPLALLLPLLVAFLLHQHVIGWRIFRSVYFFPTAISWVVIGMVAVRFFAAKGILNDALQHVGLGFVQTDMLTNEYTAMAAVVLTLVWSTFGTNTIIFITGMATLDQEIYDAARVDGAGPIATFWYITIPLLMRFIQFAFILTLITSFTALFSLIFVMTAGGPGYGTTTLEYFVYHKAFKQGVFGYAAAIGVVLAAVVFVISVIQQRLLKSPEDR